VKGKTKWRTENHIWKEPYCVVTFLDSYQKNSGNFNSIIKHTLGRNASANWKHFFTTCVPQNHSNQDICCCFWFDDDNNDDDDDNRGAARNTQTSFSSSLGWLGGRRFCLFRRLAMSLSKLGPCGRTDRPATLATR
jgi:hypothetical protein